MLQNRRPRLKSEGYPRLNVERQKSPELENEYHLREKLRKRNRRKKIDASYEIKKLLNCFKEKTIEQ